MHVPVPSLLRDTSQPICHLTTLPFVGLVTLRSPFKTPSSISQVIKAPVKIHIRCPHLKGTKHRFLLLPRVGDSDSQGEATVEFVLPSPPPPQEVIYYGVVPELAGPGAGAGETI